MAARRKAAARQAPASVEEATVLLGEYASISARAEVIAAQYDHHIAALKAERDAVLTPLQVEVRSIFDQLRTWWPTAREALTQGKRRSVMLAGAEIGERRAPPALKLPKGWTMAQAVAWAR